MKKIDTIDLKGKEYATVPSRIKAFREDCPNGLIETMPDIRSDGMVLFKTHVVKDKAKPESGEATGHALGKMAGDKAFEKLETISVGRALAMLGYMASGDVASSEEMEEFNNYKNAEMQRMFDEIDAIETIEDLKTYYSKNKGKGKEFDAHVMARKKQLTTPTK